MLSVAWAEMKEIVSVPIFLKKKNCPPHEAGAALNQCQHKLVLGEADDGVGDELGHDARDVPVLTVRHLRRSVVGLLAGLFEAAGDTPAGDGTIGAAAGLVSHHVGDEEPLGPRVRRRRHRDAVLGSARAVAHAGGDLLSAGGRRDDGHSSRQSNDQRAHGFSSSLALYGRDPTVNIVAYINYIVNIYK